MPEIRGSACDGWWEQIGYGRQSMDDLRLEFSGGSITGSGTDIIGPFSFCGRIDAAGRVVMTKEYVGLWTVHYAGSYDGEGLMWGHWRAGGMRDRWLIKFKRPQMSAAIEELVAV